MAELLKPLGYTTGQFGKNHLGDRNEMLPTVHGFDEWFGNLYHLNAEEEPENEDYQRIRSLRQSSAHVESYIATRRTRTTPPMIRGSARLVNKVEDTGPLARKRMETIDDEVTAATIKFMDNAAKANKPFFIWFNSSRMHTYTHLKPHEMARQVWG